MKNIFIKIRDIIFFPMFYLVISGQHSNSFDNIKHNNWIEKIIHDIFTLIILVIGLIQLGIWFILVSITEVMNNFYSTKIK